jgi:hypothetical protein
MAVKTVTLETIPRRGTTMKIRIKVSLTSILIWAAIAWGMAAIVFNLVKP